MKVLIFILCGLGIFLSLTNFYLSFLRGRFVETNESKFVSGIPLFGSLLIWISLGFFTFPYSLILGLISLLDTGGIHWFLGSLIFQKFLTKKEI